MFSLQALLQTSSTAEISLVAMASPRDNLLAHLESISLGNRSADFTSIFDFSIDMNATTLLHAEAFNEFTEYMDTFIDQYSVLFEDSSTKWVPTDFLKYIYCKDKNFRFRIARFTKGLTERDLKEADEDALEELNMGDIGTQFLSWEMVLVCMVLEGMDKGKNVKKAPKAATHPLILVSEMDVAEDVMTEQEETSMALSSMQENQPEEEEVEMLEGEEVIEEVPEFQIMYLHPVIIENEKFLFLHDISKALGLREDEALSVLKTYSTMVDTSAVDATPQIQVDFKEYEDTPSLEYHADDTERTLEETVAQALLSIAKVATEYDYVPESSFHPHQPLVASDMASMGSINLQKPQSISDDHASETAFQVDKFAMRTGGTREPSSGRDSSLWHYLPYFTSSIIRVAHLDFSDNGHTEILKSRALTGILCEDALGSNVNKVILVNREAALYSFCGKKEDSILAQCGLSLGRGVDDPKMVVNTLGESSKTLSMGHERLKRILKSI